MNPSEKDMIEKKIEELKEFILDEYQLDSIDISGYKMKDKRSYIASNDEARTAIKVLKWVLKIGDL